MTELNNTGETDPIAGAANSGSESSDSTRKWRPMAARQRRVLGVLIEKARTTPDAYPMTLNAITTGCNQKSNRQPQMNLKSDDVEDILEELRGMGAVAEVQTGGRVPKYRHYAYEWLGADKREIAVLCELMLRGEQTVGDLRARASRMEPIRDQGELREIIRNLLSRELMVELSPPGRGQIVSHGLYSQREREQMSDLKHSNIETRRESPVGATSDESRSDDVGQSEYRATAGDDPRSNATPAQSTSASSTNNPEIDELKFQVEKLTDTIDDLTVRLERIEDQLQSLTMG